MKINYEENSIKNIDSFKNLYVDSFPEDERRDFDKLINLLKDESNVFSVKSVFIGREFAGFLSYWEWKDVRYIEHFAIEPSMRGGGVGKKVLMDFLQSASSPVILEVEPPYDDISKRRIDFYKRCGFCLHEDVFYEQPPYDASKNSLKLLLMTSNNFPIGQNEEVILRIKSEVYNCNTDNSKE